MALIPLIIDCEAGYAAGASAPDSALLLPLGGGLVLDHLVARLAGLHQGRILVVPNFPAGRDYPERIRESCPVAVEVLSAAGLESAFDEYETSDYLLVLELKNWLASGLDAAAVAHSLREYHGATHGVAIGCDPDRATEHIECDQNGQVKRVQRLYAIANWPEVAGEAIAYSIVPARAVRGIRFTSLAELRAGLAAKGVLSRDVPVGSEILDLTDEQAFLALSEQVLMEMISRKSVPGFAVHSPGVLVGHGCEVHSSARLVGPVIVQGGARIKAGATVIGPTLVGAGCGIEQGAVVAQSVLRSRTAVSPGTVIRQRVLSERGGSPGRVASPAGSGPGGFTAGRVPRFSAEGTTAGSGQLDRPLRGAKKLHFAVKCVADFLLSASALAVLSPLLLVVAILIKLDSAGPVFFCHRRERRGGREFSCIKFRTMSEGAHSQQWVLYKSSHVDGPQFKMPDDPRVTRVGRWLRATNIDELPQLFNVLAGHMSLVGPRPSPFRENQICVPWRRARLSVRPGITGLWQLCRDSRRSRGGFHEWIYYDILYVRELSVWLDLKIVAATVLTLAGRWRVPLSWLVRTGQHVRTRPERAVAA